MGIPARPRAAGLLAAGFLLCVLPGCTVLDWLWPFEEDEGVQARLTALELEERLQGLVDYIEGRVATAAQEIESQATDHQVRRDTVEWRLRATSAAREAIQRFDELAALVDVWLLSIQQAQYFESGPGRDNFGPLTRIARRAAEEIWRQAALVAEDALPPDRYAEVQGRLIGFAREHPIQTGFARPAAGTIVTTAKEDGDILSFVLSLPLKPAKAFLDDTAQALAEFTRTTERISRMAQFMPQRLMWEMQLLLYDLEERRTVEEALASVQQISSTVATVGSTAEALLQPGSPEQEALDEQLTQVQVTAAHAEEGLAHLAQAGTHWGNAVESAKQLVELAKGDEEPTEPKQPSRPFDITEFTATAAAIDSAGQTLTRGVREVQELVRDAEELEVVLASAQERAESLLWGVLWGALLLLVAAVLLITAGAVAYRAAAVHFRDREPPPPPRASRTSERHTVVTHR